jgi:hypothetical protein
VVIRSNQQDGVPAKCFLCDRKYKAPTGSGNQLQQKQQKTPKQNASDSALQEQLRALKEELKSLKSARTASATPEEAADASMGGDGADSATQADLKAARAEISALRLLDERLHGLIQGGYGAALAAAEAKREALLARQRGGLPVKAQLAKAQTFVESTARRLEAEQKKGEGLALQQAELAEKAKEQTAATAAAASKLASAKAELAAISAKLSAENVQEDGAGAPHRRSGHMLQDDAVTRQAVADLCTFAADAGVQQALVVAGMPPDQQARVVAALGAIASNCTQQQAPPQATASAVPLANAAAYQGLTIEEMLAFVPEGALDSSGKSLLREKLLAEQAAKRQRSE